MEVKSTLILSKDTRQNDKIDDSVKILIAHFNEMEQFQLISMGLDDPFNFKFVNESKPYNFNFRLNKIRLKMFVNVLNNIRDSIKLNDIAEILLNSMNIIEDRDLKILNIIVYMTQKNIHITANFK